MRLCAEKILAREPLLMATFVLPGSMIVIAGRPLASEFAATSLEPLSTAILATADAPLH